MKDDIFETEDIYLATTLLALGYNLEIKGGLGNNSVFVFDKNPELVDDIANYMGDQLRLNPKSIWKSFKSLKDRLYG